MAEIDLSGTWRAAVADPERSRRFSDPELDDSGDPDWHDLVVPGHWRSHPAFATSDGPLLYRHRFDADSARLQDRFGDDSAGSDRFGGDSAPTGDRFDADSGLRGERRWWLVLDGVFYQGDVWLDGHYVGDTEGYFFPHQFEITDQLAAGTEHLLAVEVNCHPQTDLTHKRNLTGSLQHSAWLDPTYNPGGIWRPVRIEATGPLRIRHTRVRCLEADENRAVLALRAVVDAVSPTAATIRTALSPTISPTSEAPTVAPVTEGQDHELHHVLAAGENRIEWTVTVDKPQLWWPHSLGDQATYDIEIAVFPDEHPSRATDLQPSDRRRIRTGIRTVRMNNWVMQVNGERLFLKGINLVPTRHALAEATPDEVVADIATAKDLGLDLVRVHSHVARPELYAAADEAGMLVWQDLPLQWSYARSVRKQALRQAREAVDLLSHHPSLAIWCTHSEPVAGGLDPGEGPLDHRQEQTRRQVGNAFPSWNRSVLGRLLRRTLRSTDGTRAVVTGSGILPHLPGFDATATHLWYGWDYGSIDDLDLAASRWPNLVRFVSAFGSASVPNSADFAEPSRWPHLDWDRLTECHGLRRDLLDLVAHPADHDSFAAWRDATQHYQALLLRRQIETLRRLKYRSAGGFAQFFLADGHPGISHSILDHDRVPKLAYEAVKEACRPVIVTARPTARQHDEATLEIHVVNDRRQPLADLVVELAWGDNTGPTEPLHQWTGEVGADDVSHVATVTVSPPTDLAEPQLSLMLRDRTGATLATNNYSYRELLTVFGK